MSKLFSINTIDEFFYKGKIKPQLSKELNTIEIEKKEINSNITLFKSNKEKGNNFTIPYRIDPQCLNLSILLDGEINYKSSISSYCTNCKKNETSLSLINQEEGTAYFNKNTNFKNIVLHIKNDFLDQYLLNKLKNQDEIKKDYEQSKSQTLSKHTTNTQTAILANEIFNSPFIGELNEIFIKSKAYEIIYHEFKNLLDNEKTVNATHIKFSNDDIQRLHYAKKLITEDKKYLGLKELSHTVALNEFKLKYGFKKLFGISIGAMVLKQKMNEAKRLLENSELSINEISQIIGYKYPSSFTVAFKKYFCINPTDIMKRRKYYY